MPVNQERVQLGIDGLRSGRFKKGTSALHRLAGDEPGPDDTYCCLGVLSIVAAENGCPVSRRIVGGDWSGRSELFGNQNDEYLCAEVRKWYGFSSVDPDLQDEQGRQKSATGWNDYGHPREATDWDVTGPEPDFGPIADAFERTYITG